MTKKRTKTLKDKVSYRITRSKKNVFVRKDFEDLGGYDQIGYALRQLVKSEAIIKIGYGLYAKAKKSSLSEKVVPVKPLPEGVKVVVAFLKLIMQQFSSSFHVCFCQDLNLQKKYAANS